MNGRDIERAIIEVLTEIQTLSGAEHPKMDGSTCPLHDLPQFDSHLALLATVELCARLEYEIPRDVNVFVDEDRPRRIAEISEAISAMIQSKGTGREQ